MTCQSAGCSPRPGWSTWEPEDGAGAEYRTVQPGTAPGEGTARLPQAGPNSGQEVAAVEVLAADPEEPDEELLAAVDPEPPPEDASAGFFDSALELGGEVAVDFPRLSVR